MKAVAALIGLLVGCSGWEIGQIRYRDNPDLALVTLATGEAKVVGRRTRDGSREDVQAAQGPNLWTPWTEVGPVHVRISEKASCDELVTRVLRDLLAEARAIGGTRVQEVKFRHRWHWSGREPVCMWRFSTRTVEAEGMAVRENK